MQKYPMFFVDLSEFRPVHRVGNDLVAGEITREVCGSFLGTPFAYTLSERTYRWLAHFLSWVN